MAYFPEAEGGDMPCNLWVKGTPYYRIKDADGNPRNNPDNTLYPGDRFYFVFTYDFSGACIRPTVHNLKDTQSVDVLGSMSKTSGTAQILIPQANNCLGGGSRGALGYGGEGDWRVSWGESKSCGKVSLKISAREKHCDENGCRTFLKERTASITPKIVAPVTEVNLIEHILYDLDGYIAANPDYTNYPWDPIGIEHIATFTHKNDREGTISFRYERPHDLVDEGGYECDKLCNEILKHRNGTANAVGLAFKEYPHTSENGGGMYAYTGANLSSIGWHNIGYDVTVYNEGQMINTHTNSTDQLIVNYDPQFEHYEYTVLKDGAKYAYDDRIGLAVHYLGSQGSGEGDQDILHEERRTKINGLESVTRSYSELLNSTYIELKKGALTESLGDILEAEDRRLANLTVIVVDSDYSPRDPDGLVNGTIVPPGTGILNRSNPLYADEPIIEIVPTEIEWNSTGTINGTDPDGWVSTGSHAMFEDEGYGIIRLFQPLTDIVFEKARQLNYYYNTTTANNMTSVHFAGHDDYILWNYTYQYPDTAFSQWWNMTSYGVNGTVLTTALNVTGYPANVTHTAIDIAAPSDHDKTIYLDEYLRAKTLYDTGDMHFATAIVDETYSMNNTGSAVGHLGLWINKTALEFLPETAATSTESLDLFNTPPTNGSLLNTVLNGSVVRLIEFEELSLMDLDRYHTLELDAIMRFDMYANETTRSVEQFMDYVYPYNEIINMVHDNPISIRRNLEGGPSATVFMNVSGTFGRAESLAAGLVPDKQFYGNCYTSCYTNTNSRTVLTLTNYWGGTATGAVNSTDSFLDDLGPRNFASTYEYLFFILINLFFVWLVYLGIRWYIKKRDEDEQ